MRKNKPSVLAGAPAVFAAIFFCSLFSGCAAARGFNRGAMFRQPRQDVVVTDKDIQKAFDQKPQLSRPFRLGIYFEGGDWSSWHWVEDDRRRILKACDELKEKGIVSDAFVISPVAVLDNN